MSLWNRSTRPYVLALVVCVVELGWILWNWPKLPTNLGYAKANGLALLVLLPPLAVGYAAFIGERYIERRKQRA